jgi:hypothetical protein
VKLQVAEGDNLLDIAQANDLEMEGMSSRAFTYSRRRCKIADEFYEQVLAAAPVPARPAM